MAAAALWTDLRDTLAGELAAGRWAAGDRLPTEAQLAQRFGVNRHTVRRAIAALAEAGLVRPRQGAGVFVTGQVTEYPLSRRTRFRQNLAAAGRLPGQRRLRLETLPATADEAEALALGPGGRVHLWEGIGLADGIPITLSRSVFDAQRFPELPGMLDRLGSVTAALAALGVGDYTRKATRLSAEAADRVQAAHLMVPPGAPLLRTVSINVDIEGRPVEFGRTWFAGDRVQLVVENP